MCIPGDIYKVETLNSAQACMPTINATPNSVLPLTEYAPAVQVFKHEIGPHSKGEAESLRHQPVSNSRSQKVPVQFQSSPLVETCKQFPVQFQSSCPLEHHVRAPLKPPHSDRFPKQESVQPPLSRLVEHLPQSNIAPRQGSREEIAQALCQVVLSPKVEYMCFDGNLLKYVLFMQNFETCSEKGNLNCSRRLQLLVQHCYGKVRDAIESCGNLLVEEGY